MSHSVNWLTCSFITANMASVVYFEQILHAPQHIVGFSYFMGFVNNNKNMEYFKPYILNGANLYNESFYS